MIRELKACPFCGGDGQIDGDYNCYPECYDCGAVIPYGYGYDGEKLGFPSKAEAMGAWNRRYTEAEQ